MSNYFVSGLRISFFVAAATVATSLVSNAASAKPKYTVKEVMKALHKGEDNVAKRVMKGEGSKDDIAKLVEYYESMPLNKPELGEKKSWDEKSKALLDSAIALKKGTPGALDGFKAAVNCKACHSLHKPESK